jgi:hypothetical protein
VRHVVEQAPRQPDGADRRELGQLGQKGIEADIAGVGLDRGQHVRVIVVRVVVHGDQGLQPADGPRVEACRHPGHHRLLGLAQRRSHDFGDAVRGRRLDELATAPGKELVADPVLAPFLLGDMTGQPGGQLLGIGHAALAKARVAADLGAVSLGAAAGEVVRLDLRCRHVDLPGHVLHGVVGQLVAPLREPAPPQEELEVQCESESGRPGLVPQLVHLVADEREMVDHVVQAQVAPHDRPPSASHRQRYQRRRDDVTGNTIFPVT